MSVCMTMNERFLAPGMVILMLIGSILKVVSKNQFKAELQIGNNYF